MLMKQSKMHSQVTLISSLNKEVLNSYHFSMNNYFPLPHAYDNEFSASFPTTTNKFKDHCILACDGCHVVYTTNSEIIEDYNKPRLTDYKGYNHMHLNGFVDVISKAFLDVVIQPGQAPDEREAFHTMLDHFQPDQPEKYIVTADRGIILITRTKNRTSV